MARSVRGVSRSILERSGRSAVPRRCSISTVRVCAPSRRGPWPAIMWRPDISMSRSLRRLPTSGCSIGSRCRCGTPATRDFIEPSVIDPLELAYRPLLTTSSTVTRRSGRSAGRVRASVSAHAAQGTCLPKRYQRPRQIVRPVRRCTRDQRPSPHALGVPPPHLHAPSRTIPRKRSHLAGASACPPVRWPEVSGLPRTSARGRPVAPTQGHQAEQHERARSGLGYGREV